VIDLYPDAIQRPGPDRKVYYGPNTVQGVVLHSADGYEGGLWDGIANGDLSWHFSILYDGSVWQHYPLTARCWHSGGWGNFSTIGIEHEGTKGEPLTPLQLAASVRLVRWIAQQGGWRMERAAGPDRTLFEHNEISGTACPNGRIPWDAYTEEDEMALRDASQDEEQLFARVLAKRAVDLLTGSNATIGAKVNEANPDQVVFTITEEMRQAARN